MELDTSRSCAATKSCDITGATTIIDEQNSFICKVKPNLFFWSSNDDIWNLKWIYNSHGQSVRESSNF